MLEKIHGHSMNILYEMYDLFVSRNKNTNSNSIAFDITNQNNVILMKLLEFHDTKINMEFTNEFSISKAYFNITYYDFDRSKKLEDKKYNVYF